MSKRTEERPRYEVLTWDVDKETFTPQQGVRRGPYSLWGLKRALRKLREMGYGCEYRSYCGSSDPSVQVSRIDKEYWQRVNQDMRRALKRVR